MRKASLNKTWIKNRRKTVLFSGFRAKKKEKQAKCKHENIDTHYGYIPGEAVMEPQYDYWIDCGKTIGCGERCG